MSSKGPQEKNNSPWKMVWDICAEAMWAFGRQNLPDECGRARERTDEESRSEKVKELWPGTPSSMLEEVAWQQVLLREQGLQAFRHEARRLEPCGKDSPNLNVRTHCLGLHPHPRLWRKTCPGHDPELLHTDPAIRRPAFICSPAQPPTARQDGSTLWSQLCKREFQR